MADVKVGSVVKLKSGGPFMTVVKIDNEMHLVFCKWFENNKTEQANFPPEALECNE